ncbi:hypothetical protein [Entomobacter blattae]|uniref:hypothetical protein n=1 Tax=Entomobacter blattae TaxID=2762277 RepID=UPI00193B799A|nr:hypothetical protein [Entomobacter blattae]
MHILFLRDRKVLWMSKGWGWDKKNRPVPQKAQKNGLFSIVSPTMQVPPAGGVV